MVSKKVSVSVSKIFGFDKSIGIGFGKNLVSKKVSDSVSKKIGIGKKFRIRFRSDFGFGHTLLLAPLLSLRQVTNNINNGDLSQEPSLLARLIGEETQARVFFNKKIKTMQRSVNDKSEAKLKPMVGG